MYQACILWNYYKIRYIIKKNQREPSKKPECLELIHRKPSNSYLGIGSALEVPLLAFFPYIYKTLPKCFLYYGYCIKNVFTACPLLPEVHCEVVWVNFTLCFCRLKIVCFLIIFCTNTFNNTLIVTSITKFKGCCLLLWVI